MKKILAFCLFCLMLTGCVDDTFFSGDDGEVKGMVIEFGHQSADKVSITTRSTLGDVAESRVLNLYVYIFDSNGNRVYGHFFDNSNMGASKNAVLQSDVNCWWVQNKTTAGGTQTNGTVRLKAPVMTGAKIRILANLDTDMFGVTAEQLNSISSLDQLNSIQGILSQKLVSSNGIFPMTGVKDGVTINESNITDNNGGSIAGNNAIMLNRAQAKVNVKIRIAKGYESHGNNGTVQKLKSFTPESWQVMNAPSGSFIMERQTEGDNYDAGPTAGYFNSDPKGFETLTKENYTYNDDNGNPVTVTGGDVNGFSFYMLENRPTMKKTVGGNYHLRDKRVKDADGQYDLSGDLWEYAPEKGTYLVVKGTIDMDVDVENEATQVLNADVTYFIHLGNFRNNLDDYSVWRNTNYTYTVTIKGVKNIQVEVEEKVENESGATGDIYIANEAIHTFDAHYGQRVFAFDAEAIISDKVTWYVKTPYDREGMPEIVNGVEVPSNLDYKWVEFMINPRNDNGSYNTNNQAYHPDKTIDVIQFCKYIRQQKWNLEHNEPNDFAEVEDPDLKNRYPDNPEIYTRHRIYVTTFVNEYYYEEDPISGKTRPEMWKEFVNKPNRVMHILCDTKYSPDHASTVTGSVVTVIQRSIQTPFNVNDPTLQDAWGCEITDETAGKLWLYDRTETRKINPTDYDYTKVQNMGNTSMNNGRYNTARFLGLLTNNGYQGRNWADFVNYNKPNDNYWDFLIDQDDKATMKYSPMLRNRDNNGNGIIDADEMRWYMASTQQLGVLYVGDQGLSKDAQLYDERGHSKTETDATDGYLWRVHVISSTKGAADNRQVMVWAEEGFSISEYHQDNTYGKNGHYEIKCVRNLGINYSSEEDARQKIADINHMPTKAIQMTTVQENNNTTSVYRFDLSHINPASLRYYTSHELIPSDETQEQSRCYRMFETGPIKPFTTGTNSGTYKQYYPELKAMLERGESPCDAGYHVPTLREGALMTLYINSANWWNGASSYVCNYYSFGQYGNGYDNQYISWMFGNTSLTIGIGGTPYIRQVRDIR